MKKFFRSCLCVFAVLICGLVFVGCKGNDDSNNNSSNSTSKKDITVSVSSDDTAIAYGTLPTLTAVATYNGNNVAGTVVWDEGQVVTVDKTTYNWTFTPADTNSYNIYKGSKTLTVNKAIPTANLEVDVDRDAGLNNETLTFSYNGHIANGAINWQNIDIKTIPVGTQREITFEFIAADPNFENISGTAKITPKYKPSTTSIPSTLHIGANAEELAFEIGRNFKYGNTKVAGTCTIDLPELVAGNNTISLTFVPEDTVHYLTIAHSFDAVAFKSENSTYLVENAEQLLALSKGFSSQSFKLANDIDFSSIDITSLDLSVGSIPHYVANKGTFRGSFDGNGHKIYGINNKNNNIRFALFNNLELDSDSITDPDDTEHAASRAMIRNLVIEATGEIAVSANIKTTNNYVIIFSNITINGSVNNAKNSYAPFVSYVDGSTMLYLLGCTNNYAISGLGTTSAFIGTIKSGNILINNCVNNADIFAKNVGMFIAEGFENAFVRILGNNDGTDKCTNNGKITAIESISLWGKGDDTATDVNFENINGSFEIVSANASAGFDNGYLEISNLASGTNSVKLFLVVSARKNDGTLSMFYEEIASENVSNLSIAFNDIIQANGQRKKALGGNILLSYSEDNNGMWVVDFEAIKGISESINANAEWSLNANLSVFAVCYNSNENVIGTSNNISLIKNA